MTSKPVALREAAQRDVETAVSYYAEQASEAVALRFVTALERAYRAVAIRPRTGSPKYADTLALPGLRSSKLTRFPYLIFYFERDDHIDVLRILHNRRDIPAWLGQSK